MGRADELGKLLAGCADGTDSEPGKLPDCDDDTMPLTVRADDGAVIFGASLECGDAVYVRRGGAVSDALQ